MMSRIAWGRTIKSICLSIAHCTLTPILGIFFFREAASNWVIAVKVPIIVSGVKRLKTIRLWRDHTLPMRWAERELWASRCPKKMQSVSSGRKAWHLSKIGHQAWQAGFKTRSMASRRLKSTMNAKQLQSTSTISLECTCWLSITRRGMKLYPCLVNISDRQTLKFSTKTRTIYSIVRQVPCDRTLWAWRKTWKSRTYQCQISWKELTVRDLSVKKSWKIILAWITMTKTIFTKVKNTAT